GLAEPTDAYTMGFYLLLWGLFTFGMWVGTLRLNKALQWVFGTLVVLFALLAIADFSGNHTIKVIAGYEGIICGLLAVYACLAQILNEVYGKVLLPIGPVKH
nr:acetate uptake transporter [Candidatus Cloacimonadota bacterium]